MTSCGKRTTKPAKLGFCSALSYIHTYALMSRAKPQHRTSFLYDIRTLVIFLHYAYTQADAHTLSADLKMNTTRASIVNPTNGKAAVHSSSAALHLHCNDTAACALTSHTTGATIYSNCEVNPTIITAATYFPCAALHRPCNVHIARDDPQSYFASLNAMGTEKRRLRREWQKNRSPALDSGKSLTTPVEQEPVLRNQQGNWALSDENKANTLAQHLAYVFQPHTYNKSPPVLSPSSHGAFNINFSFNTKKRLSKS